VHPLVVKARIIQLAWNFFQMTDKNTDSFSSAGFSVHALKDDDTYTLAVATQDLANRLYDDTDDSIAKAITSSDGSVLRKADAPGIEDLLQDIKHSAYDWDATIDFKGNALCFAHFYPLSSSDIRAHFTTVCRPSGENAEGRDLFVGRILTDDKGSLIPCGIYFQQEPSYIAYSGYTKVAQCSDMPEILVNQGQMQWISINDYKPTMHVIVPIGFLRDGRDVYAARADVDGKTYIGSWIASTNPPVASIYTESHVVVCGIFEILCWNSVDE